MVAGRARRVAIRRFSHFSEPLTPTLVSQAPTPRYGYDNLPLVNGVTYHVKLTHLSGEAGLSGEVYYRVRADRP